ncbi:ankyrin repeat domain-containing protein [Pseudoalteromonas spongiae]|uniref:ankyrin repeat domain-containing protein n=1 Tax=Pseudoalteromonas spongiae TaxID=298657 RepID=UPI00026CAF41|nr:ankyrin repeat domain-containing protein [Pseudoalteromonas spongiae]ATC97325.1 hypothetical protein PSPO_a0059 [Pseudoalteromonas spongiae UST010723-006]
MKKLFILIAIIAISSAALIIKKQESTDQVVYKQVKNKLIHSEDASQSISIANVLLDYKKDTYNCDIEVNTLLSENEDKWNSIRNDINTYFKRMPFSEGIMDLLFIVTDYGLYKGRLLVNQENYQILSPYYNQIEAKVVLSPVKTKKLVDELLFSYQLFFQRYEVDDLRNKYFTSNDILDFWGTVASATNDFSLLNEITLELINLGYKFTASDLSIATYKMYPEDFLNLLINNSDVDLSSSIDVMGRKRSLAFVAAKAGNVDALKLFINMGVTLRPDKLSWSTLDAATYYRKKGSLDQITYMKMMDILGERSVFNKKHLFEYAKKNLSGKQIVKYEPLKISTTENIQLQHGIDSILTLDSINNRLSKNCLPLLMNQIDNKFDQLLTVKNQKHVMDNSLVQKEAESSEQELFGIGGLTGKRAVRAQRTLNLKEKAEKHFKKLKDTDLEFLQSLKSTLDTDNTIKTLTETLKSEKEAIDITLIIATQQGNLKVIQETLALGATIPENIWFYIASSGSEQVAHLLVQHGASINNADSSNLRPLHYSIMLQSKAVFLYLLNANASPYAADVYGMDGLDLSLEIFPQIDLNAFYTKKLVDSRHIISKSHLQRVKEIKVKSISDYFKLIKQVPNLELYE